jgi:hypothetical protein
LIERRSSASNEKKHPAVPSIVSPPDSTRTAPSTTETRAPSLDLVVAERLAGLEHDQHRARAGSDRSTTGERLPPASGSRSGSSSAPRGS